MFFLHFVSRPPKTHFSITVPYRIQGYGCIRLRYGAATLGCKNRKNNCMYTKDNFRYFFLGGGVFKLLFKVNRASMLAAKLREYFNHHIFKHFSIFTKVLKSLSQNVYLSLQKKLQNYSTLPQNNANVAQVNLVLKNSEHFFLKIPSKKWYITFKIDLIKVWLSFFPGSVCVA